MSASQVGIIIILLLLLALLGGIFTAVRKMKRGMRSFARQFLGADSLKEGFGRVEQEYAATPKSVSAMTSLLLPKIKKDFPEFQYDEMKVRAQNVLTSYLLAVSEGDPGRLRLAFDFPCDIIFPKCSLSGLLRFSSPELREEYDSLAEKVLDYMELVTEFDRPKLFLTVNLRSYLEDSVFSLFADTLLSHGYQILMIENYEKTRIPQEERRIIFKLQYQIGQL